MNPNLKAEKSRRFLEDPAFNKLSSTESHRRNIHDATLATFGYVKGYDEGAKDERKGMFAELRVSLEMLELLADNETVNNKNSPRGEIHGHIKDRITELLKKIKE